MITRWSRRIRAGRWILGCGICTGAMVPGLLAEPRDKLTYHYDAQRSGWNDQEDRLTPLAVNGSRFGQWWQTVPFASLEGRQPRLFATPLYVARVTFIAGQYSGKTLSVVYAVTDLGDVYAINAVSAKEVPAGAMLWHRALLKGPPGMEMVSTPVIDAQRQRIYAIGAERNESSRMHALDLRSGEEVIGWPIVLDPAAVNAPGVNRNSATPFPSKPPTQRSALNLSPDGSRLYVAFAEGVSCGWLLSLDTDVGKVASAFSTTARAEEVQGGMWASGGPSVDRDGFAQVATGSSVQVHLKNLGLAGIFLNSEHNWGQSVLRLRDDPATGFVLVGTYTPFNFMQSQVTDIDLGSGGTTVIDLDPALTTTPHLLVLGGKQGNVYLLNRVHLPGSLVKRPAMSNDARTDGSLLPPEIQPHLGTRGPVNVFGPYADKDAMNDQARSRTTPAYFQSDTGKNFVFVTGSAKTGHALETSTPPGLARLEIVTSPKQAAYLRIDQMEGTQVFQNPGSPIVTSHHGRNAIVWVLDTNVPRTAPMQGPNASRPILYAFDALSLKLLWKSAPGELASTGKYNEPTVVDGLVVVGTDRIQAFGVQSAPESARPVFASIFPATPAPSTAVRDPRVVQIGKTLFEQRCAVCHTSGLPGIPPRDVISRLEMERIVEVLRNGVMKPQAMGLNENALSAVANYLTSLASATTVTTAPRQAILSISGRALYVQHCITCHMPDGSGIAGLQPVLRGNAIVTGQPAKLIRSVLIGPTPKMNNTPSSMPAYLGVLSDADTADLLTYVRQAFGPDAPAVESETVAAERKKIPTQPSP